MLTHLKIKSFVFLSIMNDQISKCKKKNSILFFYFRFQGAHNPLIYILTAKAIVTLCRKNIYAE